MKIEVKQLPKSELLITIEVPDDVLQKYEDRAAKSISEQLDIPGFRRGQAPKAFVISQVGPDAFFKEVLNVVLPNTYFEAIKEKNLQVVSRPDIKIVSKTPLKYEAHVAVLPEITVKGVDKIKIPQPTVEVTDKEIDEVVEQIRKYRATFKPLSREVQKGDRVEIDFKGYDEGGAALDKTKSANHPLFVGEGSLVPGFEEELVGMKVGFKKKFPVKFPKDFHHEPLKGKTVHFEVEMKRAEETILPTLDEEFVKQVMGEKKSVPEFKEALRGDLHKRKVVESRRDRENALLERFLKDAKLEVPPILIEEEIDYMVDEFKHNLEDRGLKFETYLKKLEAEKRDIRKDSKEEAEKRIRVRLILNHLFKTLNIEVSEEEIKAASVKLLERAHEEEKASLAANIEKKGEVYLKLKNNLLLEKLFKKFLD